MDSAERPIFPSLSHFVSQMLLPNQLSFLQKTFHMFLLYILEIHFVVYFHNFFLTSVKLFKLWEYDKKMYFLCDITAWLWH